MPKLTLLQLTQDILNDLDSDEVNSINDTLEAQQVAQIIKSTYYHLISGDEYWPHLRTTMQLEASGTTAKPTHMRMPENTQRIEWIKYNKRKSTDTKDAYVDIKYLIPKEFMDLVMARDSSDSTNTSVTDFGGVVMFIKNDAGPTYWTSFDDEYVIFDSYDSDVDSTLQASKTQVEAYREPTWSATDSAIPDLPSKAFMYLQEEAKSACFLALRQTANEKAEQRSVRERRRLSLGKFRHGDGVTYPSYGRK